jgi:hypothetical protein
MKVFRTFVALFALILLSCGGPSASHEEIVASNQQELAVTAGFANIALGRPTRQSSTVGGRPSSLVVDGNTDGNWYNGGVTHTNLDTEAWWEVDLGTMAYIEAVRVFGRTDCCQDRLSHYFLYISETPITGNNPFQVTPANGYTSERFSTERYTNGVPDTVVVPGTRKRGRYVRIYVPGPQFLSLAEVEVWGAVNLTYGKFLFPTQSSDPFGAPAYRATDDNANGNYWAGSVTHTDHDNQAWWQIDLGAVHEIAAVDIWGRSDSDWDRLANFYVMASDTPFNSTNLLTTLNQPGVTWRNYGGSVPQWSPVTLNMNATGRYLRVQLESSYQYLSLAEVRIWGLPTLGATATQSSDLGGAVASRALDGNRDGNFWAGSVTHTDLQSYPLWAANFGQKSSLGLIRVWNRTDSESQRLNDFQFFGSSGGTYVHPGAAGVVTDIRPMSIQNPGGWFPTISNLIAPTNQVGIYLPRTDYLSLAEVEMFGQPAAQCGAHYGTCCAEESGACLDGWACTKNRTCRPPEWPASSDYTDRAGNPAEPADWDAPWTNQLQGVAHDATHWYFANQTSIVKIPLGDNIRDHYYEPDAVGKLFEDPYYHYGDPTFYRNAPSWADPIGHQALIVPLEVGDNPQSHYIVAFTPSMQVIGMLGPLPGGLAWLAFNPADGLLYLPQSYDPLQRLDAYRIQWPTNGTPFDIIYVKTITLNVNGTLIGRQRVQGGEFSENGHLYLASWACTGNVATGVYGFESNGQYMMGHAIPISFPGACQGPFYTGDELEGIDIIDLDGINPLYGGQIHVLKVDVDAGTDNLHFMHVKLPAAMKSKL